MLDTGRDVFSETDETLGAAKEQTASRVRDQTSGSQGPHLERFIIIGYVLVSRAEWLSAPDLPL